MKLGSSFTDSISHAIGLWLYHVSVVVAQWLCTYHVVACETTVEIVGVFNLCSSFFVEVYETHQIGIDCFWFNTLTLKKASYLLGGKCWCDIIFL